MVVFAFLGEPTFFWLRFWRHVECWAVVVVVESGWPSQPDEVLVAEVVDHTVQPIPILSAYPILAAPSAPKEYQNDY